MSHSTERSAETATLVQRPSLEFNLVEHCNLRCHSCDHGSPLSPVRFASVEQFEADLSRLARSLHVEELRLLGGEPLLHPQLLDFLDVARRSDVGDRIVLVTNGLLLHKMPDALWSRIDRLWLSIYPGVKPVLNPYQVAALCRARAVDLLADVKNEFFVTLLNNPINSKQLVLTIYKNCKSAHEWSCHTVHDGQLHKCPTGPLLSEWLRQRNMTFTPRPEDSVPLEGPHLAQRIAAYLADDHPLRACEWCLGSSGPPVPSRQLGKRGLELWMHEDHRELIRRVERALATNPGGRLAGWPVSARRDKPMRWLAGAISAGQGLFRAARADVVRWLSAPGRTLRSAVSFAVLRRTLHPASPALTASVPGVAHYRAALSLLRAWAEAQEAGIEDLGGLVVTLLDCGERRLALHLVDRVCSLQRSDGSWQREAAPSSSLATTAKVVFGLASAARSMPQAEGALRHGCEWLLERLRQQSSRHSRSSSIGGSEGAGARLWTLASLARAGAELDHPPLQEAAHAAREREQHLAEAALRVPWREFWAHAHMEAPRALVSLGARGEVAAWSTTQEALQRGDGSLPAFPGAAWTCPTCVALTAEAWCLLGRLEPARRALGYLCRAQTSSGGFRDHPLSTATTFLDAFHALVRASFDEQVSQFDDQVESHDGRLELLLREAGDLTGKRALDAGCGRGAIARALSARFPDVEVWGVDHSEAMLVHLPASVRRRRGSIQNLPFEEGLFDLVYCVEALEHAGNPQGAVAELCRVARPGGLVVIIDKNVERAGALAIESWERWFRRQEVEGWLRPYCHAVRSDVIQHAPHLGPDLFLAWMGRRRRIMRPDGAR